MHPLNLLTLMPLLAQDPATPAAEPPATEEGAAASSTAADAESLRTRIHDMRMNLLLGGDHVRAAEAEAVRFYSHKQEVVDGRLDTVGAELTEKRASYDVALQRALEAQGPEQRRSALGDAARLSGSVNDLEWEAQQLNQRRDELGRAVAAVQARDRDRERLVAQLETSRSYDLGVGLTPGAIGLAPSVESTASASPFDDEALVEDLLARDPRSARALLYDVDPVRYWQRFPLRPPTVELAVAMRFPLPDLPEHR